MAEWSVQDVALPPVAGPATTKQARSNALRREPARPYQPSHSSAHRGSTSKKHNRVQRVVPGSSTPCPQEPARPQQQTREQLARSPSRRVLSPRVQQVIDGARRRQGGKSPSRRTRALSGTHRKLSLDVVKQARQSAPAKALERYRKDDFTLGSPTNTNARTKIAQWRMPPSQPKPTKSQPLVGVTRTEYWKTWNRFSQDNSDPRIMLPAGVKKTDIERSFFAFAPPPSALQARPLYIERDQLKKVLQAIGIAALPKDQERRLFRLTRAVGIPRSGDGNHISSERRQLSPRRNMPIGYSLPQLLACFVVIRQVMSGAPFTVEPLMEDHRDFLSSEQFTEPGSSVWPSHRELDSLPPIKHRSPVHSAPASMRRPRNSSTRATGGRTNGMRERVVYKPTTGAKVPSFSSYDKFKRLEQADVRAGRVESANGRNPGWSVVKGSFVRTGDKYLTDYEKQVQADKESKRKFLAGPFIVTDHRATVAQKEWKIETSNVHEAREYTPKHGHMEANVQRFNKMFGS